MTSSDDATDGAQTDSAGQMSYGDYLKLDAILGAQHPLSEAHDEMLSSSSTRPRSSGCGLPFTS